jgi:uncharacterized protein
MNARPPAGPIFDFHARLLPRAGAIEDLLTTMDACGVARAAVSAGGLLSLEHLSAQIVQGGFCEVDADNEWVRRHCAASGGRLVPFYFANPHAGPGPYRSAAPSFRGLELSPAVHGVGFDDARTAALVEIAAQMGHPVYVVSLARAGSRTEDLVALARAYPQVTFVFGHCGFIGIDAAGIAAVAPHPNIVAETSGCFTYTARLAMQQLGAERVLFGTEHPLQHPRVELAKFACLNLDPPQWRAVAWSNAHRLLNEETL